LKDSTKKCVADSIEFGSGNKGELYLRRKSGRKRGGRLKGETVKIGDKFLLLIDAERAFLKGTKLTDVKERARGSAFIEGEDGSLGSPLLQPRLGEGAVKG